MKVKRSHSKRTELKVSSYCRRASTNEYRLKNIYPQNTPRNKDLESEEDTKIYTMQFKPTYTSIIPQEILDEGKMTPVPPFQKNKKRMRKLHLFS